MKSYNLENLKKGLQENAQFIKGQDITDIATIERINPTTVRTYLKGEVTIPSLGKAILNRCREILISRNNAA